MHQYTSNGHLNGYDGRLDFDKAYCTAEEWEALATGNGTIQPAPLMKADPYVVGEVLNGHYGNGPERAERLTKDGYDADDVQRKVNELYGIALSCKRYTDGNEEYLNQIIKIIKLL